MKNLRKRMFPLVPVFALLLSAAIGAIKARTAALFTPCEEQKMASLASSGLKAVAGQTAPGNLVILIIDGVAIIDSLGSSEMSGPTPVRNDQRSNVYSLAERSSARPMADRDNSASSYGFGNMPKAQIRMLPNTDEQLHLASQPVGRCKGRSPVRRM